MTLVLKKYVRMPFYVEAVQVTKENINEVAKWCSGEVRVAKKEVNGPDEPYVKVEVYRSLTDRQTKAFVDDWVLYAGTIYKVYTPKAFEKSFQLVENEITGDPAAIVPVTATTKDERDKMQDVAEGLAPDVELPQPEAEELPGPDGLYHTTQNT